MTKEQRERLKARRDEIITVAMGKCWHINTDGEYCNKCGKYVLDEDSLYILSYPEYSTPEGWFELYNWLTKKKPDDFEDFYNWFWYDFDIGEQEHYIVHFVDNLPDLFVQWLVETETGWYNNRGDKELTPLGKLMKEVLDGNS